MRLHVTQMDVNTFTGGKEAVVERLRGDLLLGTRDLPMTPGSMRAMFGEGSVAWAETSRRDALGWNQISGELERVYELGSLPGDVAEAPESLVDPRRSALRDPTLGTLGGGNHFLEVQVVDEILDSKLAYAWGVRLGAVAYMIHTGSRAVGQHVGSVWMDRARQRWPVGETFPTGNIFALHGADARRYLAAAYTAANYAFVNRILLAEIMRLRMREVYGDVEAPLVFDVPHNIVLQEGDQYVHRKGATPAHLGQPVLIPGSMGDASFLAVGLGSKPHLRSASHGAGRAISRFRTGHRDERHLGLEGVECITLKPERLIEEAPAAYKPIASVMDIQVRAGVVAKVARMRPLLTFKG